MDVFKFLPVIEFCLGLFLVVLGMFIKKRFPKRNWKVLFAAGITMSLVGVLGFFFPNEILTYFRKNFS
jgi:hypothetical protein